MKLSIAYGEQVIPVELHEDLKLDAVLQVLLASIGQPNDQAADYTIERDGTPIDWSTSSKMTLKEIGFEDGQLLSLKKLPRKEGKAIGNVKLSNDKLRNLIMSIRYSKKRSAQSFEVLSSKMAFEIFKNFHVLPMERRRSFPQLDEVHATHPGDFGAFYLVYSHNLRPNSKKRRITEHAEERNARDEAAKRKKVLDENLNRAMEEIPEGFFGVDMLYIECKINGHPVKIFVDTGAQMSVMSESIANRIGLSHLIDPRFKGKASGVGGVTETLGKICRCSMTVDDREIIVNFTVLPDQGVNHTLILGLDLMVRHRVKIDLFARTITFDDTITTTFLKPDDAKKAKEIGERDASNENPENGKEVDSS